jgi:hypothetical protein
MVSAVMDKTVHVNPYLQNLYHKMFDHDNINLEDIDFYNLVQEKAFLKTYHASQYYMKEKDLPNRLSILLHGRMHIHKRDEYQRNQVHLNHESTHAERFVAADGTNPDGALVGVVYPYEFIDSYEWLASQGVESENGGAHIKTRTSHAMCTIKVPDGVKECVVLTWKKEMLEAVFKEHPRLRTCIHAVVGKDIAEKMLRITGHSVVDDLPDVDMIRRAHGVMRCSRLADIAYRKNITERETSVLPSYSRRAGDKFLDEYTVTVRTFDGKGLFGGDKYKEVVTVIANLSMKQRQIYDAIGAGPWCELPDEELRQEPWTSHLSTQTGKDFRDSFYQTGNDPSGTAFKTPPPDHVSEFFLVDEEGKEIELDEPDIRTELENMYASIEADRKAGKPDTPVPQPNSVRMYEQAAMKTAYNMAGRPPFNQRDISVRILGVPHRTTDYNHHLLEQKMHSLQRSRLRIANFRLLCMDASPMDSLQPSADMVEQNKKLSGDLLHYFEMVCPQLKKRDLHEILKWGKWRTYYRPGTVLQTQGEESNYLGVLLQGRLVAMKMDEMTLHKRFVQNIDKYHLVGSEDFSSKFRTARRFVEMPPFEHYSDNEDEKKRQKNGRELSMDVSDKDNMDDLDDHERYMYSKYTFDQASKKLREKRHEWTKERIDEFEERLASSRNDSDDPKDPQDVIITNIPAVLFAWDFKDMKRLMLADPHVEAQLSTIVRGDITWKLDNADMDGLATRICGVPTQAAGDKEVRMCAPEAYIQ